MILLLNVRFTVVIGLIALCPSMLLPRYDGTEGSEDSGLVVADSDSYPSNGIAASEQSLHTFKYLHLW